MSVQTLVRCCTAGLLGTATALLVSCGSSGSGLIAASNSERLQRDFAEVAQAAQSGNGSCVETESMLGRAQNDFLALPPTVDRGLHTRLQEGMTNLRTQAMARCVQPTKTTATATTTTGTATTATTSTEPTATTEATSATTQATTTPGQGGGTAAPGEGEGGAGNEGAGGSNNGGSNAGGASPGGGR